MSMPQDRATLPVIPYIGDDSEPWQVLRDLEVLHRDGLIADKYVRQQTPEGMIPAPDQAAFSEGWQLLDELGLRGAYEAYVRAEGAIDTCPTWCIEDHLRRVIVDPMEGGRVHIGHREELHFHAKEATVVDVSTYPDGDGKHSAPVLNIYGPLDGLTSEQALALCDAIHRGVVALATLSE